MKKVFSIEDVVKYQLCTGCGVCVYMEPESYIMSDAIEYGRRPVKYDSLPTKANNNTFNVCPGMFLTRNKTSSSNEIIEDMFDDWGPILNVWEGFSTDEEIRFKGSSGGVASAIALYCLEKEEMTGVLHTSARKDVPYLNETVLSQTRSELLDRAGSRYAPASPCEKLGLVENSESPCVFIGKPCDVAAVQNARKIKPKLDEKIGLTIAFFCAGTPSTQGTLDLLNNNGVNNLDLVKDIRYRGKGWPGQFEVLYMNESGQESKKQLSYEDSWGFLQKYRQWRCYICPDHTGEFADIAVGDPWYNKIEGNGHGKSLIIARTKKGVDIIQSAVKEGYITLEREDVIFLPKSQPNLLVTRASIWGRLKALSVSGAATPSYGGFSLFRSWFKSLSLKQKAQSIFGVLVRVRRKKLNKRINILNG